MAETAKKVVAAFREAVQDLLVPEFRALRVPVDSLRTEMQLRDDRLQESIDSVRTEMRLRSEQTAELIRDLGVKTQESIRILSEKLDFALDIRERLSALEARLPKQ